MKKILFLVIGYLMVLTSNSAMSADNKIYNAKTMTLPNAMQVVVVENHRTPAVTHMVWYRIGGADEELGASGLAHYLEHLMFKGTELVPSGELSKKVKSWGGNDNAFTSWDFTAYFQTVPKDKLESVMRMEADRMVNLNFKDEDALTERDVIVQERKQRTDSNPQAQLDEGMRSALFVNHPYSRPIIGWDHELKKLNPMAAREFYKKYYAPKNAILVVSGDVNAKDVFEKAAIIYGGIENREASTRPQWPIIPKVYGAPTVVHSHSSVEQPVWRKLWRVPSMGQDYLKSLNFMIADSIIGGNTGKLYQSLVVEKQLASGVGYYYSGVSVADATISLNVMPRDGVSSSQIENAVNDVLTKIATEGVTDIEVKKSIAKLQDESVFERDSLTGPAMMIGYQLASGLNIEQIESMAVDLEKATAKDVQATVANYMLPQSPNYHAVVGHLIPQQEQK